MHIPTFHPHRAVACEARRFRGNDPAHRHGDVRLIQQHGHTFAIRIEHRFGAVDDAGSPLFPLSKPLEDPGLLTHREHHRRRSGHLCGEVIGRLETHVKSHRVQVLAGQAENLGVVEFPPRRMRPFAEDAPAFLAVHATSSAGRFVGCSGNSFATASASNTSSPRSTSTTVWMGTPKTGSPLATSQVRKSLSLVKP